jgi:hypothetical protein
MLELIALVQSPLDESKRQTKIATVRVQRLMRPMGARSTRIATVIVQRLIKVNP